MLFWVGWFGVVAIEMVVCRSEPAAAILEWTVLVFSLVPFRRRTLGCLFGSILPHDQFRFSSINHREW